MAPGSFFLLEWLEEDFEMAWSQIPTFVRDEGGIVRVNEEKQFIQPFELPVDAPNRIITLAPGQTLGPFPLTAAYDGPIEAFYVKVVVYNSSDVPQTTYDISWFLEHPGKRIQFMPRSLKLMACAGDAGRPYILPETIFIPAVQSLNVTLTNNDQSNSRKVELVLGGIKFYPFSAPEKTRRDVFSYTERRERTYTYFQSTDAALTLTGGQLGAIAPITVPDNSDLEVFKLTAQSTAAFRMALIDGRNNRGLTGGARIHSSLLFGGHDPTALSGIGGSGGIFPARWATTFLVQRSVQLQAIFDELSGSSNVVEIVLGGRKVAYG